MDQSKISVIIPTLLKNIDVLNRLISLLSSDSIVDEIIIINNSDKDFPIKNSKIKILSPSKNMYVNPSWNYGIHSAKNDLCALFNDDLLVCKNFCSQVERLIRKCPDFGVCGMDDNFINNTQNLKIPEPATMSLIPDDMNRIILYWGSIIFIKKQDWTDIPNEMKIWWGDNFIRLMQHKKGRKVLKISNVFVSHLKSLSSSDKSFNPIKRRDTLIYTKIDPDIKNRSDYKELIQTSFYTNWQKIKSVFYKKKTTKSGKVIIKILKIPVYRRRNG